MPTSPDTTYPYDVFISYSPADADWVWGWLVPRLKAAGPAICTDQESFDVGVPRLINMENAVAASRHTLLVLTEAWVQSHWTQYEALLVQTDDPSGLLQRTLPVLRGPCTPPPRIAMLTHADLSSERNGETEFAKLLDAIRGVRRLPNPPPISAGGSMVVTTSVVPVAPPTPDPKSGPNLPSNPFSGANTITEPSRFVGREAELKRLRELLQAGSVTLVGETKTGMSSLLRQFARTWEGKIVGPIDCQGLDDKDDLFTHIAGELDLRDHSWRTIREVLRSREVLLLLDELDAAPARGITLDDLARFRSVAQSNPGFKMVTVSHRPLKEVFLHTGLDSPGYSFLQPLKVGTLTEADARLLLSHPWAPDAPQFDAATTDQLLKLAGGHPFKLHRVALNRYKALADPTYNWRAAYEQDLEQML
ncbi:MAG: toll/interleukin-1 receptor domain-containing protein [Chloroflexi bacterium]|nr:toll/interleukin-1 receptor domain-containing protein [Chloroflexota bacterium]